MTAAFTLALALAALPQAPPAQPPAPAKQVEPAAPPTPREKLDALQKEFNDAQQAFSKKYREAKTDEERQKVVAEDYPDSEEYGRKYFELAQEAKGTDVAIDAYVWALQMGNDGELKARCYDALLADHVESPKLGAAAETVGRYTTTIAAERFVRTLAEKSPHHEVKGKATYSLAGVLLGLASLHDRLFGPDAAGDERAAFEGHYGTDTIGELEARDAAEMRGEAEDLLDDVAADYAKVKGGGRTLGEVASADLFELRHLQIGMVAPEIVGKDLDGVEFKLSDYRGKVVVLDFWGFW